LTLKENYLKKKEELLKQKISLASQKDNFGRTGKNWIEPLRSWILDIQKAKKLSQGDNFEDIKAFVQKVGTNHQLLDKSASFSFSAPWDYVALRLAQSHQAEPRSGEVTSPKNRESIIWCSILELVRTHFAACDGEEFPPRKFGKAAEPHR
jgi:hypothetical protein